VLQGALSANSPAPATHHVVPFPSCPPLNISWMLPDSLGQPLTITKMTLPDWNVASNLRPSRQQLFKAGKEALNLVSLF
jgi:hypothetical protein